ncbi:MAG: type I restriction enzyme HsdR N-terminal domain-containing protein [Flavobacteriia bacterium]|nr:type I restriction enzyme HsdR N-terminal domain-containing protein [Flavobacteriia bacterium]
MPSYPELIYSSKVITLRKANEGDQIKDLVRNTWLHLTPEEWVRQHLIGHLLYDLGYPPSTIAIEKKVTLNGMPKRFDALIYHKGQPAILIECKAPNVPLNEEVFHQACRYNTQLKAPMTVLSNGLQTIVASVNFESGQIQFVKKIPFKSDWD